MYILNEWSEGDHEFWRDVTHVGSKTPITKDDLIAFCNEYSDMGPGGMYYNTRHVVLGKYHGLIVISGGLDI